MERQYLLETSQFQSSPVNVLMDEINSNYSNFFNRSAQIEQRNAWKKSMEILKDHIPDNMPVIMEYVFPIGMQRLDYLVIGHKKAHVIEVKGWKNYRESGENTAIADGTEFLQPCYQLEDYLAKFRNFHTASESIEFSGSVFMYNTRNGNQCELIYDPSDYRGKFTEDNFGRATKEDIDSILNGKFSISKPLLNYIKENKDELMKTPTKAFAASGYGLSEEQMKIMSTMEKAVFEGKHMVFLVRGKMGSGKTLVALNLLLDLYSKNIFGLLAYKNNRLINSMRISLGPRLSNLLKFYSVGPRTGYIGLGERNFDPSRFDKPLKFVIYDESQRMKGTEMIKLAMSRAPVTIFFYDEDQILTGEESGTRENFLSSAGSLGMPVVEFTMNSVFRMRWGNMVDDFIQSIFNGTESSPPDGYEFNISRNVQGMIDSLKLKKDRGEKVALLASFTRSSGREGDDIRVQSPEIRWLMKADTEYPHYWIDQKDVFTKCASIYGSQGFETDYAGLIWGDDLVWRGKWEINPDSIMDTMGGRNSLRNLAMSGNKEKAMKLLINRYRIFLSRGIKGTYIYFEDDETMEHFREILHTS